MSEIPLSDQIVARLNQEMERGGDIHRIALLSAALRDLELAAMAGAIRLSTQAVVAAVEANLAKTQTDVAEALTAAKSIFGGGPAEAPAAPLPCNFCGQTSILWRHVGGEQVRVCLDHIDSEVPA